MRASLRLTLWLLCFAHTAALAQSGAKPARLAILAADPALGAASDVLTAALSSDSTVSLLERNEIDRVLSEQRLTASGLATQNGARLGRLLAADGLVFLETAKINDNPTLTVRIVAAGPGVIVGACYDKNPPEDLQKWAADLAERVHALAPKLSVAAGQAIPVSVLNLRSSLPMREARDLERELTLLLIHRLASEPQCFVLERVQMEKLAFEKALASGSPPDFWTSSCVVDGEISASASNAVVVKLRLERAGRDPQTVQAEGSAKHLPELAELLASELLLRLGRSSPVQPWQPVEEGRRFYAEAKSAFQAGLLEESLAAAESSRILGFASLDLRELLLNLYASKMIRVKDRSPVKSVPAGEVDLESALQGLNLYAAFLRENIPVRSNSRGGAAYALGPSLFCNASRVLRWYRENGLYSSRQDDLELLREDIRNTAQLYLTKEATNNSCEFYCVMACYAPYWYDDPAQVFQAYDAALAPHFNDYAYSISWVRHHLAQYRDKPYLFGAQDLNLRVPWLVDWQGTGEARLKDLWRGFVQKRVQSAVLNDRLDGWLLAYHGTESEEERAAFVERAKTDLWANRQMVATNVVTMAITTELIASLPFSEDFRFQILNYYLGEGWFPDQFFLNACLGATWNENHAHAATLYQSLQGFEKRLGLTGPNIHGNGNDVFHFQDMLVRAFPDLREPPSQGLNVTMSWPPAGAAPARNLPASTTRQVLFAGGAIWVSADENYPNDFQTTFTRVELPSFRTTVLPAPFRIPRTQVVTAADEFNHSFAVSGEWLFWVQKGRLARCALATGKWDETEAPANQFPLLKFVNDSLYYAFPTQPRQWAYQPQDSGILRIDPRTLKMDVLASSRRKPAVSRLDDVPPYFVYDVFSGPENRLYASVLSGLIARDLGELYCFSGAENQWSLVHSEAAYNFVPYRAVPFGGGNVIQPIGCAVERAFILWQNGSVDFLFPDPYGRRKPLPARWPAQSPLWEHTPWNPVVATTDGNDLWVLGPRQKMDPAPLNLYLFQKGGSERRVIPLNFPSASTDNYPTMDSGPAQLLGTPDGLVIAGTGDTAFWFLPKQALQAFVDQSIPPGKTASTETAEAPGRIFPRPTNLVPSQP